MGYDTPVTNRTASSFFNVADWTRIYRNAQLATGLSAFELETTIDFNEVTDPTDTDIASVDDFNTLLANIERLRLAVAGESISGADIEVKDDWIAGVGQPMFNYANVNYWETLIDLIWDHFNGDAVSECPTLTADLTVLTGERYLYVDCLNVDTYLLRVQGTGEIHII